MAASKELSQSLSDGSAEVVESPCSLCQAKDRIHVEVESCHYCVDCDTNMCAACTQWHARFPAMASHQVVDISKAPGTPAQKPKLPTQRCGEHHGRVIDHYCQDDDTVACETCVNIYHRNCMHMKYIPDIAKGTSKGKSWQVIKKSTGELITPLKQMKYLKEDNSKQLDKSEAKSRQEVQDLRVRLYKYVDNLADAEDAKIRSIFQEKKGVVQKDIAVIADKIEAIEAISKKLNACKGDNESELFVYIKQGEKVERDVQQELLTQRQSKVEIPIHKINSTIEESLNNTKSLGQFEKTMTSAKFSAKIKVRDDDKDQKVCQISGICLLPDASLVMADFNNSCLKLVDQSLKLTGYLNMFDVPCDVCFTDNNEVAVTLILAKKVQFVSVGSTMQKTHSFNVGDYCRGITYSSGQLFVCCGAVGMPANAHVYNLSGSRLHTIQHDQAGQPIFTFLWYITVSSCGSKLHVTDKSKVVTTDKTGKVLATYTDPDLCDPRGVCCLDTCDFLVCAKKSNCVHYVSEDGRKLGKLLTENDGIQKPKALCYDPAHSRLIMSGVSSDYVKVYDM